MTHFEHLRKEGWISGVCLFMCLFDIELQFGDLINIVTL